MDKNKLSPLSIIRIVRSHYPRYWLDKCGINHTSFADVINKHNPFPKLAPYNASMHSRLTLAHYAVPEAVSSVLMEPEVQAVIAEALKMDVTLFEAVSEDQVCHIIEDTLRRRDIDLGALESYRRELVKCGGSLGMPTQLHAREVEFLQTVARSVLAQDVGAIFMKADFRAGLSHWVQCLANDYLADSAIKEVHVITLRDRKPPDVLDVTVDPFMIPLQDLSLSLGHKGGANNFAGGIIKTMAERGSLLVIVDPRPELFQGQGPSASSIAKLAEAAIHQHETKPGPATLVIAGHYSTLVANHYNSVDKSPPRMKELHGEQHARIRREEAYGYFTSLLHHYVNLRNLSRDRITPGQRKRVRWHYESNPDSEVWAAEVRCRAFFYSQLDNHSCADPTLGWHALAGMREEELPREIRAYYRDLLVALSLPARTKRFEGLKYVRWASTALYWLTDDGVRALDPTGKGSFSLSMVNSEPSNVKTMKRWVRHLIPHADSQPRKYVMDLPVKAVIQDFWRNQPDHAPAHYRIALMLYDKRDDKDALPQELPFKPHWGRSRIYMLSECIRHLMRTIEHIPERQMPPSSMVPASPKERPRFPAEPVAGKGPNPFEIANYCFEELFWRQINDNSSQSPAVHNRKLALRHGAYQWTLDLLQRMSTGGKIGKPHWALTSENKDRYLREVAFALIDVGNLDASVEIFSQLESSATGDALEMVERKLNLALVHTIRDDIDKAEILVDEARTRMDEYEKQEEPRAGQSLNNNKRRTNANVRRRIAARHAQILYLRGMYEEAKDIYDRHIPSSAITRDVAHLYIAILSNLESEEAYDKALAVCLDNLSRYSAEGLQHEALGFRIALAHLLRGGTLKRLLASEQTLDNVYKDIIDYGCSERTYLSFLLEAGRLMKDAGKEARAYAAYLRPCLDRARSLGYKRIAESARTHSVECLEKLLVALRMDGAADRWPAQLKADLTPRGTFLEGHQPRGLDPHHSYDIEIKMDPWQGRLSSTETIMQELESLAMQGGSPPNAEGRKS